VWGWFRVPVLCLVGAVVLTGGAVTGCDDACATSCGTGVIVWWSPGDVPKAARYRLCVNGVCEPVKASAIGNAGQYLHVSPEDAAADRDVVVRFEAQNAAGESITSYDGTGEKDGDCCPGVSFRVDPDGTLVVADM
jgi:hypothetical protein